MPATTTAADIVRRDRMAMVRVMVHLAAIAVTEREAAIRLGQSMPDAHGFMALSQVHISAGKAIRDLLLASGVTDAEIMAIATEADREAELLAVLEGEV